MSLILTGDQNNQPQELTDAQVNHLRRLLAWLVCEYNLSDEGQRGIMEGLHMAVSSGADQARAQAVLDAEIERVRRVPAYIRQAVRMLTKAAREHDAKSRVIDMPIPPRREAPHERTGELKRSHRAIRDLRELNAVNASGCDNALTMLETCAATCKALTSEIEILRAAQPSPDLDRQKKREVTNKTLTRRYGK